MAQHACVPNNNNDDDDDGPSQQHPSRSFRARTPPASFWVLLSLVCVEDEPGSSRHGVHCCPCMAHDNQPGRKEEGPGSVGLGQACLSQGVIVGCQSLEPTRPRSARSR
ncbi:hypothetical protein P8C59_004492 [Phyllachora maydis]|uniref:Uncharacterized protein n=1 Tax=Phyllachora maydis TaxID=1825666 RepID=A0AAD9I2D4_9PEZI|nr:hypothetical protein P8C59_004492 [Phyllachora maydis]